MLNLIIDNSTSLHYIMFLCIAIWFGLVSLCHVYTRWMGEYVFTIVDVFAVANATVSVFILFYLLPMIG